MPGLATKQKDLYLGKCLDDLHKLSEIKPLGNNVTIITKSADKVFRDAQSLDTNGDEERAFVMYIKYFNIIKQIKSKADYKKQKDYFDNLLGKKNQLQAIERAEKLSDSLKERYDLKEAEAVARKLSSLEVRENTAKKTSEPEGSKAKNEPHTAQSDTEAKAPGFISCTELCSVLRDAGTCVIVMDVRSQGDFSSSHISHTKCISVPEDILLPGSTVTHIGNKLPSASQEMWSQRKHADHIVLLDWRSNFTDVTVGTPLRTLKDALFKFDLNTIIKSEPLILEGGYEQWLMYYPTMTTNAHVARPSDSQQHKPASPTITLDFDYPDLDENLQKKSPTAQASNGQPSGQPTSPSQYSLPSFDRSLKPSRPPVEPVVSSTVSPSDSSTSVQTGSESSAANLYPSIRGETTWNNLRPEKNTNLAKDSRAVNLSKKNNLTKDDKVNTPSERANLAEALNESVSNRQRKESELANFEAWRDVTLSQDQDKLDKAERSLRELETMKRKEEKDVADLMRMKRKLKEEIDEQKRQQNEHRLKLSKEEEQRKLALEHARVEEDERKERMLEVERMREERKRQEQQHRDLAKRHSEDDVTDGGDNTREEADTLGVIQTDQLQKERTEEEQILMLERKSKEEAEKKERLKGEEDARKEQEREKKLQEEEQRRRQLERQKLEEDRKMKELERQKIEEERKRKEKEKQKLEEERKRKELEEAQERQKREAQARDKAAKDKLDREQRERERQAALASKPSQATSKTVPSSNLPTGWEKRLDRATNRYFYIDHNRGQTHWTPPQMLNNNNSPASGQDTYRVRLKEEPSVSSSRGMSRSHSSPDIMKELAQEEAQRALPTVNRGTKPPDSVSKVPTKPNAYALRKRDLNPVYGNVGAALTGLRNLGNTCYMNSTIQCLNNTSPLVSYFLNDSYLHDINRSSSTGMHGEVVDDFAVVIKALWSQQYRSITPRDLKHTIGKYNPMFAGYQQQDSQEFLTFLLDGLHEGLNEVRSKITIPEQSNDNMLDREAAAIAWKHHKMLHKSIIVELFQGQLKSTLMCRTCGKTSVTFQAFMFLSLPIPASSRCSLKDCIKEFVKPELMTGSSRWKCPRCKVDRDSEKKIDIWKLPHILLIGLNRFYSEGMWMQKKTTFVDFPLNDLDLSGYIAGPPPRNSYNLYGTSNHYGTMEGGHYTAFCRSPVNKKWFKFDDHDVYEMSSSDVKTSAAFVLYYTAIDLPAPQYKPQL